MSHDPTQQLIMRGMKFTSSKVFDLLFTRFMFQGIVDADKTPGFGMWDLNLYFSLGSEASNDLDYIYGLLAVTKSPITPDYTKSICEVNLEFMAWALFIWKSVQKKAR
ncbi:hypothetical protein QWA68_012710 [Fusarium oxysporum]|nr:hypothetical protein QWA68_012710 [Fusarium oxysporum]